ncbi:carotenoid cleavage dioxygenase 7, chloroplastic [Selaginella moellendorffii]|uniref:carotenoid cleavage dioxygenase 7, chloroplastic n=1 Tax=Selaginella moellendorffii TaxID=88036 RepID=UPI000D1CE0DD|nr:carotenoid cleavage dioxygenase 7, chloroplastic [Selaginella moellendorffii]|eukprot:XP_024545473.1 carotenoid cleavage dioxygenase 7, chloroplastic [Selaginella moellendorffii]
MNEGFVLRATVQAKSQTLSRLKASGYGFGARETKSARAVMSGPFASLATTLAETARSFATAPQGVMTLPRTVSPPSSKEVTIREPAIEDVHAFWDYQRIFGSQRAEVKDPVRLKVVEGRIPSDLKGSYYLCGPGLRADDHGSCVSPLDGHGYLRKFHFGNGDLVQYSARYVRTEAMKEEFDEESRSWKFQYRGPFSLLRHGHRIGNFKVMKNVANTSVLKWGGKLLCLWEGGEPYEVDEDTLETIGTFSFYPAGGFNMPKERVLAHFKIDERRQRLVVITSNAEDMVLPKATFTAYEFDADFKLIQRKEFLLDDQLMVHDWALTDEHYVILGNRVTLDVGSSLTAMAGLSPMINCLAVDESTTYSPLYMLPRFDERNGRDWTVPAKIPGQLWVTHIANASEETLEGGHKIRFVVDACLSSYKWFSLNSIFGYKWQEQHMDPGCMNNTSSSKFKPEQLQSPRMHRVTVDVSNLDDSILLQKSERFKNANFATDFPVINSTASGGKNEFTYATTNSGRRKTLSSFPMDSITKLHGPSGRASSWWAGERCAVGEPQFVKRKSSQGGEDDGYVIFVQYSFVDERRYLVILDARRIGARDALVAKVEVPREYSFPFGFHGLWQDS